MRGLRVMAAAVGRVRAERARVEKVRMEVEGMLMGMGSDAEQQLLYVQEQQLLWVHGVERSEWEQYVYTGTACAVVCRGAGSQPRHAGQPTQSTTQQIT